MFNNNSIPKFIASFYAPERDINVYWVDLSYDPNGKYIRYNNGGKWELLGQTGGTVDLTGYVKDSEYKRSDFITAAERTKLAAIEEGAQRNPLNMITEANLWSYVGNPFSNTLLDKLTGIEAGAQVNATGTVVDSQYASKWDNILYRASYLESLTAGHTELFSHKADKIATKVFIEWGSHTTVPFGRTLTFNTSTTPVIAAATSSQYPAITAYKVKYDTGDNVYFGMYRQNTSDSTHIGLFRLEGNNIITLQDIYNTTEGWRSNQWFVKDEITNTIINLGNPSNNFYFNNDVYIRVDEEPEANLEDVYWRNTKGLSDLSQSKINRVEAYELYVDRAGLVNEFGVGGTNTSITAELAKKLYNKITSIDSLGEVLGSVATYPELPTTKTAALALWGIEDITKNDFAIVIEDVNQGGLSSRYLAQVDQYGVISWVFVGTYQAPIRDFTKNPIKASELANEAVTTAKLANLAIIAEKIENQTITGQKIAQNTIPYNRLDYSVTDVFDQIIIDHNDLNSRFNEYTQRTDNPNYVNKDQIGLDNVENISPSDMPVSIDQQEALDLKVNYSDIYSGLDATIDTSAIKPLSAYAGSLLAASIATEAATRIAADSALGVRIDNLATSHATLRSDHNELASSTAAKFVEVDAALAAEASVRAYWDNLDKVPTDNNLYVKSDNGTKVTWQPILKLNNRWTAEQIFDVAQPRLSSNIAKTGTPSANTLYFATEAQVNNVAKDIRDEISDFITLSTDQVISADNGKKLSVVDTTFDIVVENGTHTRSAEFLIHTKNGNDEKAVFRVYNDSANHMFLSIADTIEYGWPSNDFWLRAHPIVPTKSTFPPTPKDTEYITEAQVSDATDGFYNDHRVNMAKPMPVPNWYNIFAWDISLIGASKVDPDSPFAFYIPFTVVDEVNHTIEYDADLYIAFDAENNVTSSILKDVFTDNIATPTILLYKDAIVSDIYRLWVQTPGMYVTWGDPVIVFYDSNRPLFSFKYAWVPSYGNYDAQLSGYPFGKLIKDLTGGGANITQPPVTQPPVTQPPGTTIPTEEPVEPIPEPTEEPSEPPTEEPDETEPPEPSEEPTPEPPEEPTKEPQEPTKEPQEPTKEPSEEPTPEPPEEPIEEPQEPTKEPGEEPTKPPTEEPEE